METLKKYHYTYYSYEEWGRGYFGSRGCKCLPEEDINYLGSPKDKTFNPKYKIILKDDYATREEAYADEIILQEHYKVVENPHFANQSYQTSTKFYVPKEQAIENGKKGGNKTKELGVGIFGLTPEEKSKNSKKSGSVGGKRNVELGVGIFSMTEEEKKLASSKGGKIGGKIGGRKTKELGVGFFAMSEEEKYQARSKGAKTGIGGKKAKELGVGIFALSKEQRSENAKITNSQKWMCLETGFITHPATLSKYQKARNIDTSKRKRIS